MGETKGGVLKIIAYQTVMFLLFLLFGIAEKSIDEAALRVFKTVAFLGFEHVPGKRFFFKNNEEEDCL